MRCPNCGTPVPEPQRDERPNRPFCSRACKLADLARWFDGSYAVPGEPADPGGEVEA